MKKDLENKVEELEDEVDELNIKMDSLQQVPGLGWVLHALNLLCITIFINFTCSV